MTGAHGVVPHSLAGLPADAANSVLLTARPRARGAPANDWTICDVLLGHTRDTPLQNLRHCCGPDALSAWSAVHLLARLVEVVINSIVLHSSGVHQCSRRAEKLDLRQVAEAGDVSQSSDHDPNLRHVGLDDTGCAAQGLCGVVMAFNLLARNLQRRPITVDSLGSGMHRWVDSDTAAGFVKDYSKEHDRELHVHELGEGSEQLDELAKMQQSQQSQQKADRQTLKAIENDDLVAQVTKQSTAVMSDMQVQVQTLNKASALLDNGKAFLGRQREVLLAMAKETATKRERQEKLLSQEEAQEREILQLRRQIEDQQRQIAKTRRVSHAKTAKLKELKKAAKDAETSLLKQNEKTQEVRTKNLQLLNQTRALTSQLQSKQAENQKLEEEDLKRDEADDED
mmetsp:Transcript_76785/g.205104  ORF Transcript_76785/g.205104 Transcript_76785/m.205104 type:complete len:398 (-) Transcript_76785:57-1250(-)